MEQPRIDRRKRQRRRDRNVDTVDGLYIKRRGPDRRQKTRRDYPRVIYPLKIAPQVLNMRAQVVGISAKAVRFFFSDFDPQMATLKKGSKVKIDLKFHDGYVAKTSGIILRKDKYQEDRDHFVCLFDKEIPPKRIDKEQTYLLKKLPEISSEDLEDLPPILFFD
ncbi:MAG: hypothetical protein ABSE89_07930 [Sedimentisphaerales bacterium]